MRYKSILMDIDDTIFDFQQGNRNAIAALMAELGLSSPTVFDEYQAINHACWEALERGEMTQEILHVERFRRFLASKGRADDPQKVADRFAFLLGRQAIYLPHAEESVRAISEKLPVVLLTNGITVIQKSRLACSTLANYARKIVISQEVGVAKPDPRIFELALDGLDPSDALMIGDGLQSDVRGANNAGVDVCWYNPKGKKLPEGMHAEYEVRDIREFVGIALGE
ncbi:MAG: YjjG family noncanonical pyrimidine nucleotidase [Clostridia bacterium]|nr:YjjG family noncanonical pyrimidine nucleotidase [Clostridia bacterium]